MTRLAKVLCAAALALSACAKTPGDAAAQIDAGSVRQAPSDLLAGEVTAVSYSGYRAGQQPGRASPTEEQLLEDLELLVTYGFRLVRLYDSSENSAAVLELIRLHDLPISVLLGVWLKAEFSNHERCPWLNEPIPDEELAANALMNMAELQRGIALSKQYDDIVIAVNVGNEALVDWNDHMVPLDKVIAYVRQARAAIEQPVTVADNYEWWIRDGAPLAAEVDFLGIHTYPALENKTIDQALAYSVDNVERVRRALPAKPIAILEAGWPTEAYELSGQASEASQARYYREMAGWAKKANMTVFFFAAFDESWKGDPNRPDTYEKHWGLFDIDRKPKQVLR